MKRVTRLGLWLALCLSVMFADSLAAQPAAPQEPPDKPKPKLPAILSAKPLKADPGDDALRKLLKARYNEVVGEVRDCYEFEAMARSGGPCLRYVPDQFYGMWKRLVEAGLEAYERPADKIALLTAYLEVTREAEKDMQLNYEAGKARIGDFRRARYERLDAEIRLLRATRQSDRARGR
jgi:hypothetical protein